MRKLVCAAFVSLDGVMQGPGGPEEDTSGGFAFGGWTFPLFDDVGGSFVGESFAEPFDLLLGRKTYDIFAGYWPHQPADSPIAEPFNRVAKYVATSSPDTLDWNNSHALTGDIPAAVAKLKAGDGPTLLTQGSTVLLHALQVHDLIDEYRVMTFPLVLGPGKRLFDGQAKPGGLSLGRSITTPSGVVMSVYQRAGEVRTGSFAG
jgi:dihydrofolate reductase